MNRRLIGAIAISLVVSSTAYVSAGPAACKVSSKLAGQCRTVRGRFFVANGTPSARIWIVGTKRLLGVTDGQGEPEGQSAIPDNVKRLMGDGPFYRDIYGNYEVCPLEPEKTGRMQTVCIEQASHLSARDRPQP